VKLSISVMMHPSRAAFLPYLSERLEGAPAFIDDGGGLWATARRAWASGLDAGAEYHLVVQDDALVCDDFRAQAEALLDDPSVARSFYFGRRRLYADRAPEWLEAGHVDLPILHWGLAICLPTAFLPSMLAFADAWEAPQDDAKINRFLKSRGIRTRYPLPSLIDHRCEVSLVTGDAEPGRRAVYFKGAS